MEDYDIKLFARGRKYNEDTFRKFILHLRESLIRYNYLDEVREDEWIVMFEGSSIRADDQFTFRWHQADNHCVYLFDVLEREGIIVKDKLDITISRFFNIKNVAQTRYSYYPKPKESEVIEKIVGDIVTHLSKL